MKKHAFLFLSLAILIGATALAADDPVTIIEPADTGQALVNPQMGWTFHHYSNITTNYGSKLEPSDTLDSFPGLSVIYLRLPWSYLEPEEGRFDWSMVDTPAQRWIDKGCQVAFRFTCAESWMRYATPKWVQDAGAKGYNFTPGEMREDGPYWEPDYGDPVFLEKLERFLAAAAARYDGNPNVAFIDVGSVGVWGEGHTFASTKIEIPRDVLQRHIDLHLKYFKMTLLAINDDFAFHDETIVDYAFSQGLTLRDDSILVQAPPNHYFHTDFAQKIFSRFPVILENEHYGGSRDRGNWGDGSKYLEAVEDYHAAYASIHWWPYEFLEEQKALIDKINLRLGYRLQLRRAEMPQQITLGPTGYSIPMTWANAGVAPCYPGSHVALTLKDEKGGIVAASVDESFSVRDLAVGPVDAIPETERTFLFFVPQNAKSGTYTVFVSVGDRDGTPRIALPLAGEDGFRRYPLGTVIVEAK